MKKLFFVCLIPFLFHCNSKKKTLFERLSPEATGISFNNSLIENDTLNVLEFTYFYNGGGVGIGDVNNDGLADIYFTGNQVSSKLYLNKGNWKFEDITESAGVTTNRWARGVSMVDLNADGHLDIYVSVAGTTRAGNKTNLLFINQGNDAAGQPTFREQAQEYGLADTAHTTQTAFLDYDRDGDLDAYLLTNAIEKFNPNLTRPKKTQGEGLSTDRLYRNEGITGAGTAAHPVFKDVSKEAGILMEGYGLGIAVSDLNADGWPDIYCANDFISNDLIWINNQNGTFSNQASRYIKHQSYNGMGTDIADFNNDGLVDIVVLDMLPEGNKRQKTMSGAMNFDKYQSNLALNYEPQFMRNTLQLNQGFRPVNPGDTNTNVPVFSEIGRLSGVSKTDWSWSALFADFDNDGYRDLFITNGYTKDITDLDYATYQSQQSQFGTRDLVKAKQRAIAKDLPGAKVHNYLYQNNGYLNNGDLTFSDQSEAWGLSLPTFSNGAAFADLDNDGDLDLIINNINDVADIYQNHATDQPDKTDKVTDNRTHFLRLQLKGSSLNLQGLGSKVRLSYQHQVQVHEQAIYRGFQSTVESTIHFGLGAANTIDSLEITWPDGKYQLLRGVKADQLLALDYRNAGRKPSPIAPKPSPWFSEVSGQMGIHYTHQENDYIDFKEQPLLPHKYSQNGPGLAVGDVNGDGLEDFFVGGASGFAGKLFLQTPAKPDKPSFTPRTIDQEGKQAEDLGALLFDADQDKDLDLYVVSGGSEIRGADHLQDRLYRNDGKGNFKKDSLALPTMPVSGSCVTAADFDRDGDLDLFVGGRVVPGAYPYTPQSFILRNDQGKFKDVTSEMNPELKNVGMVTSALWTDFDADGQVDLMIVGEWMPLTFFKNRTDAKGQRRLENVTSATGLEHTSGWWNSLTAGDFDNDGDVDYVAGNLGLNTKYKASAQEPVCVYAADYDKNGTVDPILCYFLPGEDGTRASYPTHPRDMITDQMVSMRKKFPRYADYAVTKAEDLLSDEERKKAFVVRAEYFQSSYLENLGKGKFKIIPLPTQAQLAPVFGMVAQDYDGDGNLDLLITGNSYATEVQTGQYDALIGLHLKGNGKGGFMPISASQSGFLVEGDAKGMAELTLASGQPLVLSAINSGQLKAFLPRSSAFTKVIPLAPLDAYAECIVHGKKRRQEFYYGSTYLSQSSRLWRIPKGATSAVVFDYMGKRRNILLQ
ncbi:MAG: VCBS repeat-containing protein [Bacteroidota bacterium]